MRRHLVSFFAAALALTACAIDDRNVEPHDADDNGGGTGGTSGGSTGGSKATGGSETGGKATGGSATGGKGGTGGSTTGGTTSTGGTAGGGPDDCNGDPLEPDEDVIRGCLMQVGCNPFIPSYSLSFCISSDRLRTFSQDDCGSGAMTCDDYFECLGVGYHEAPDCTSGEHAYCDSASNVAFTCNRYPYGIDCTNRGGECATFLDDAGQLTARCAQPSVGACTDAAGTSLCSGTVSYTCIDGQAIGSDCDTVGAECRDGTCYYVLEECSTIGATCGTSGRMDVCYEPGDLASYFCPSGLECQEGDTYTACVAPGCTTEERCTESCDGTELTLCYGGVPITVDCTDYGFKYCFEGTLPSDDTFDVAYCGVPDDAPDRVCEVEDTDDTCQTCGKEECCAEWTTCVDDSDCIDFLNCANPCADAACVAECGNMYPAGLTLYSAFDDCRTASCTSC